MTSAWHLIITPTSFQGRQGLEKTKSKLLALEFSEVARHRHRDRGREVDLRPQVHPLRKVGVLVTWESSDYTGDSVYSTQKSSPSILTRCLHVRKVCSTFSWGVRNSWGVRKLSMKLSWCWDLLSGIDWIRIERQRLVSQERRSELSQLLPHQIAS